MVIDFRVRPPYRGFRELGIFTKWAKPETDPKKMGAFGTGRGPVPSCEQGSMELFMQEMDEAEVDACVVMGRRTKGEAINAGNVSADDIYELANAYPGRFIPFAGIDPTDDDAAKQVERVVKELGFKGISIDPGWCVPCMYADDERIAPVYETCAQLGTIVTVTCSAVVGPDMTYSDPVAIQHVASRWPNLKIVVAHACWPHIEEMIGVSLACPNVYLCPDVYFYTDNMPMHEHLVTAANGFMMYRTLFASTYPVGGLKESILKWSSKGLTPKALQCTLHDNAAELLGL